MFDVVYWHVWHRPLVASVQSMRRWAAAAAVLSQAF
jgi:hypothetical protein